MTEPLLRDALRLIQEIVAEAKGSPLGREEVRRVEQVLGRLVAPAAPASDTGYSQREATILFADLRGFSAITAANPPDVLLGMLSRCFGRMTEVVVRHYGTIDKFMGDGVMVVFHGDPGAPRDHARRALLCAVEMQLAMDEMQRGSDDEKISQLYLGIGISTGKVMTGLIGSQAYRAYTVIGEDVNLAARIEAFSLRGQVLMSEATYAHCKDFVHVGEGMDVYVKGKSEPVRIREALAIPSLGKVVPRRDQRKSPRVQVDLAMEYRPLADKLVGEPLSGKLSDLSYHGALAQLAGPLPLYSEIKLAFDLPGMGSRVGDIYARVVSAREKAGHHLAGLEFTSIGAEVAGKLRLLVQVCIQEGAATSAVGPATLQQPA
jgi:adenylate cyclase